MRISFFCQGCHFKCKNCFNPDTHDFYGGKEFNQQVLNELMFVFTMYENQYAGLSLLGGECFENIEVSHMVAKTFKEKFPHKTIWIYSGYTYEKIIKDTSKLELLKLCDILVDGQFIEELKDVNLKFKGSRNQRIINVQESLKQNKVVLYME